MGVRFVAGAGAALIVLSTAGAALALDAAAVIKARHDFFHSIGKPTKGIKEELSKPTPSIAEIQKYAAAIDAAAPNLPSHFPAGSGIDSGLKTGAKAEIWTKSAEFKKDADGLATAAHALNVAAQKGDVAAIKPAFGAMGGACKTCHDTFRKEEEH